LRGAGRAAYTGGGHHSGRAWRRVSERWRWWAMQYLLCPGACLAAEPLGSFHNLGAGRIGLEER
jgi:hypothetical protein